MARIDRKALIYQHAAALFMTKGYAATSMRDLAQAVGIEPSSLYSHIKSKEDLLVKICTDTALRFTEGMDRITHMTTGPSDQIAAVIDLHLTIAEEDPSSVTVFTDEWTHLPAQYLDVFEKQRRSYQKGVKAIIQSGIDQGVFAKSDASILTKTMLTSLRWVHTWHRRDRLVDYQAIARAIKAYTIAGLVGNITV